MNDEKIVSAINGLGNILACMCIILFCIEVTLLFFR